MMVETNPNYSVLLAETVEHFLNYLKSEKQFSLNTQINYRRQLYAIIDLNKDSDIIKWQALDSSGLRLLISRSRQTGLQAKSLFLRLFALRSFFD